MDKEFWYRKVIWIRLIIIILAFLATAFTVSLIIFGSDSTINDICFAIMAGISSLVGFLAWLFPLSAVQLVTRKHASKQNNKVSEPVTSYQSMIDQTDIKQKLQLQELPKTPPSDYSGCLDELLRLWFKRYARTNSLDDLDKVIDLYEQAIKQTLSTSFERRVYIKELRQLLIERYAHTNSLDDLNKAIELIRYEQCATNLGEI